MDDSSEVKIALIWSVLICVAGIALLIPLYIFTPLPLALTTTVFVLVALVIAIKSLWANHDKA